ncbi:hypothetical protein ACFYNO_25055 [Kitasatospora sp. NPDC006697]|uniref:hypothetical protein n=1 Tax=Kitasatospora sp. NPDC006697 TaxID=3364020 RepID=UPI0036824363
MDSVHRQFAAPAADTVLPTAGPDDYLLPPGHVAALTPDGRIVAVPIADTATFAAPVPHSAPLGEQQHTAEPGTAGTEEAGLSLAVRQCALYGSLITLAAGGAFWMVAAAVTEMAPAMDGIVHVLKWFAIALAMLVGAVVAAKVRTRKSEGDTTLSLFHSTNTTTKTTSIGKQIAKGRSTFTNNL